MTIPDVSVAPSNIGSTAATGPLEEAPPVPFDDEFEQALASVVSARAGQPESEPRSQGKRGLPTSGDVRDMLARLAERWAREVDPPVAPVALWSTAAAPLPLAHPAEAPSAPEIPHENPATLGLDASGSLVFLAPPVTHGAWEPPTLPLVPAGETEEASPLRGKMTGNENPASPATPLVEDGIEAPSWRLDNRTESESQPHVTSHDLRSEGWDGLRPVVRQAHEPVPESRPDGAVAMSRRSFEPLDATVRGDSRPRRMIEAEATDLTGDLGSRSTGEDGARTHHANRPALPPPADLERMRRAWQRLFAAAPQEPAGEASTSVGGDESRPALTGHPHVRVLGGPAEDPAVTSREQPTPAETSPRPRKTEVGRRRIEAFASVRTVARSVATELAALRAPDPGAQARVSAPRPAPAAPIAVSTPVLAMVDRPAPAEASRGPHPGGLEPAEQTALVDQVVQAIRVQWGAEGGDVRLRLQPEYLGELTVSLKVQHGVVTAQLEASTAEVRHWIEANETVLRQSLAAHDLRLDRLIVRDNSDAEASSHSNARNPQHEQQSDARRHPRQRDEDGPTFEIIV